MKLRDQNNIILRQLAIQSSKFKNYMNNKNNYKQLFMKTKRKIKFYNKI